MILEDCKVSQKIQQKGFIQIKQHQAPQSKDHHKSERKLHKNQLRMEQSIAHTPHLIGVIHTKRPAFLEIFSKGHQKNLLVSSFSPFEGYNEVKMIPNIDALLKEGPSKKVIHEVSMTKDIYWPNNITVVDDQLMGKPGFLVASGFFVKPCEAGAISFLDSEFSKTKITEDKQNWFYHEAIPTDLIKNGNPGILTVRSNKQIFSFQKPKGELVFFERPHSLQEPWKEHVLVEGPDVFFAVKDLDGDGKKEIVATDFFHNKLYLIKEKNGKFEKFEIDSKIKKPFGVTLADINRDGKPELLVTSHTQRGSVFVYEIPKDLKKGRWKKREILSGVTCRIPVPSEGAPGNAIPFYPQKGMLGKPYIFVSGDGSGKVHMLVPKKPMDPQNWDYEEKIILKSDCTIGKIKMDFDESGYARLFVPLFEKNKICCFSFAPAGKLSNRFPN